MDGVFRNMASTQGGFILEALTYCLVRKNQIESRRKRRSKWSKHWLLRRNIHSHVNLIEDLREDPDDWRGYLRMDVAAYEELLRLVTPFIQKEDTVMRKAITPHERLSCTLRFLATGRSYKDLRFSSAISYQALSIIIPETCKAIYQVLRKEYMKIPQKPEEWKKIASQFEERWNFPHCLGAVDGKHVRIVAPQNSGSYFYNYKNFNSMVLMAVVNANYEFVIAEFGVNGRISDGGVLEETTFYKKLKDGSLHIPKMDRVNGSERFLNYVFVGDEAFALTPNFMKPYSQRELNDQRKVFNYRLSRARRIVENAFGILANRFRLFQTCINLKIENIDLVVMTCCALHNFLRRKYASAYTPAGSFDEENRESGEIVAGLRPDETNLTELQRGRYRSISNDAKLTREQFLNYFNNEGSVPWQLRMCHF